MFLVEGKGKATIVDENDSYVTIKESSVYFLNEGGML